ALAKRKGHGAITIQKSKSAVVIGHTAEGCQQGNTNKAVGVIADYLESVGL
ncbi:MAG: profilin family protein, partial [Dolichospermum sp.]